jgi:hypothetical protein
MMLLPFLSHKKSVADLDSLILDLDSSFLVPDPDRSRIQIQVIDDRKCDLKNPILLIKQGKIGFSLFETP